MMKNLNKISLAFLIGGIALTAALMIKGVDFKADALTAAVGCPPAPAHPVLVSASPNPALTGQIIKFSTDPLFECEGDVSCEWRWSGAFSAVSVKKPYGATLISFSDAGVKQACVEVWATTNFACGPTRVGYGCGSVEVKSGSTAPKPTVQISANPGTVGVNQPSVLNWSSTNASSCTASGAWSGNKSVSGSETVRPGQTSTYTLTCSGDGGTASASATVNVSSNPLPTVQLSAYPTEIYSGQKTTLTWSSTNASSCTASNGWSGSKGVSGSEIYRPTQTTVFTLVCSGNGVSVSSSATVKTAPWPTTGPTPTPTTGPTPTPTTGPTPGPTNGPGGGGGPGGCGTLCQPGTMPTPTPGGGGTITPPTIIPPYLCKHDPFATPVMQGACGVSAVLGGTCSMTLNDGFSIKFMAPAGAVSADAIVSMYVYDRKDLPNLQVKINNSQIIGDRIVYIVVQDRNCAPLSLNKDSVISFVYPSFYASGYNETTFGMKSASSRNSSWADLITSRNISANTVSGISRNAGYFSIFGEPGTTPVNPTPFGSPIPLPTAIPNPTLSATPEIQASVDWRNFFFLGSLFDALRNLNLSLCQMLSILNVLLLLALLWILGGKKLLAKYRAGAAGAAVNEGTGTVASSSGMGAKAALVAAVTAPKRAWNNFLDKKIEKRINKTSVAPIMEKENSVNPQTIGSDDQQFIIAKDNN